MVTLTHLMNILLSHDCLSHFTTPSRLNAYSSLHCSQCKPFPANHVEIPKSITRGLMSWSATLQIMPMWCWKITVSLHNDIWLHDSGSRQLSRIVGVSHVLDDVDHRWGGTHEGSSTGRDSIRGYKFVLTPGCWMIRVTALRHNLLGKIRIEDK